MDNRQRIENDLLPFGDTTQALGPQPILRRMAHYGVSGLSLAVIEDGALAWTQVYGTRAGDTAEPISPSIRFAAASISKPLVAMAVLRLVQEGVLDLDTDVNRYLASWQVPASPLTQHEKVTLRRLLSHSAGLTTYGFWGYRPSRPVPTLLQVLDGQPPANSVPVRVDNIPGSRWRYSSGGYTIIQQLLIDVLHQPFADTIHDLVLAPLQMANSAIYPAPPPGLAASSACGHDATGAPLPENWRSHPELGSAGLWSTASDLAAFILDIQRSLLGQSNQVLSAGLIDQMLTVQISNWALGFAIDGQGDAARFTHGGAELGFRCYLVGYRYRGQGAVVMTNGDRGDHLCIEILHSIARAQNWPAYYHYQDAIV